MNSSCKPLYCQKRQYDIMYPIVKIFKNSLKKESDQCLYFRVLTVILHAIRENMYVQLTG